MNCSVLACFILNHVLIFHPVLKMNYLKTMQNCSVTNVLKIFNIL
uniref:Uncharacterized protein n=1 Tax=Anguilla anguilla TaxID=7936 RepID=A0A0E9W286_ANGAN